MTKHKNIPTPIYRSSMCMLFLVIQRVKNLVLQLRRECTITIIKMKCVCSNWHIPVQGPNNPIVGTPGLGYPLLLCLSKGLVVVLDYVQTAGPLWSGVLFSRQQSRTCLTTRKGPGTPRVPEKAGAQPEQPGLRASQGIRTPAEVPDPSWGPGPPV